VQSDPRPVVSAERMRAVEIAAAAPTLEMRGVSKTWARGRRPVLDAVDLAVDPGEVVALVGENGTGKTTLLRIVAGIISPDQGSVSVERLKVGPDRRSYQRKIGFLSAGPSGLYARYSVRRHLEYWATIAFVPRGERQAAVERAVERFELAPIADQRADRLSMGQRQRLRLAMAFLHGPRLCLLDEPRNSLDAAGLQVLTGALSDFVADGGAGIWCAPSADDVAFPVARVLTLAGGNLS
jgi:heme ABC exporter ATP-binding subunit CcmA